MTRAPSVVSPTLVFLAAFAATWLVQSLRTASAAVPLAAGVALATWCGLGFVLGYRAGRFLWALLFGIVAAVGSLVGLLVGQAMTGGRGEETDAYAWLAVGSIVLVAAGWGVVLRRVLARRRVPSR